MSNQIHPTAIIEGDVQLGENNRILPNAVLIGPLSIGDNNWIGPNVVIGSPGQDTRNPRYDSSDCKISIGSNNIIREFTAIQKPCYKQITRLGDNIQLMQSVHIPHDAIIEDDVVVTPMVVLGGISKLLRGSNIAMGAAIHQYSVIGQYSIVAMGAAVIKNVKPFSRHIPTKAISVNEYAIKKFGFEKFAEEIQNYVLHGSSVTSPEIKKIIDHYEMLHLESERGQY